MGCFTAHLTFFFASLSSYCYKYLQHMLWYQLGESINLHALFTSSTTNSQLHRAFPCVMLLFNLDISLFKHKVNCLFIIINCTLWLTVKPHEAERSLSPAHWLMAHVSFNVFGVYGLPYTTPKKRKGTTAARDGFKQIKSQFLIE